MLNGKKIFIEISPGIGDLVMATPIFRRLKELYPRCELTVASKKKSSLEAIQGLPYVDHVHLARSGISNMIKSLFLLRKQDYVFLYTYSIRLAVLAWIARVQHRIGNCKKKYARTGLFTKPLPFDNEDSHVMYQTDYFAMKIGNALGVDLSGFDNQCDVSEPSDQDRASIREKLDRHGVSGEYIVLSPFGNSAANMDEEMILKVLHILSKKNCYVVITGGSSGGDQWTIADNNGKKFVDMRGETSISEVIALIEGAKIVISSDSGTSHMACAVKKETAIVYSSSAVCQWAPRNFCHAISLHLPCAEPCKMSPPKCPDHKCIRLITEDMLSKVIDEALKAAQKH